MKNFSEFVLEVTKAQGIGQISEIQSLWSGYGSIKRLQVKGAGAPSVIVKLVSPPSSADHPRGWNTGLSHQRKLKSYQVESNWYETNSVDWFLGRCTHSPMLWGSSGWGTSSAGTGRLGCCWIFGKKKFCK